MFSILSRTVAEIWEDRVLISGPSSAHCDILGKSVPPSGPLFPDPCTKVNGMDDRQPKQLWGVEICLCVPAPPLANCMALSKSLIISESQSLHVKVEGNNYLFPRVIADVNINLNRIQIIYNI